MIFTSQFGSSRAIYGDIEFGSFVALLQSDFPFRLESLKTNPSDFLARLEKTNTLLADTPVRFETSGNLVADDVYALDTSANLTLDINSGVEAQLLRIPHFFLRNELQGYGLRHSISTLESRANILADVRPVLESFTNIITHFISQSNFSSEYGNSYAMFGAIMFGSTGVKPSGVNLLEYEGFSRSDISSDHSHMFELLYAPTSHVNLNSETSGYGVSHNKYEDETIFSTKLDTKFPEENISLIITHVDTTSYFSAIYGNPYTMYGNIQFSATPHIIKGIYVFESLQGVTLNTVAAAEFTGAIQGNSLVLTDFIGRKTGDIKITYEETRSLIRDNTYPQEWFNKSVVANYSADFEFLRQFTTDFIAPHEVFFLHQFLTNQMIPCEFFPLSGLVQLSPLEFISNVSYDVLINFEFLLRRLGRNPARTLGMKVLRTLRTKAKPRRYN